MNNEIERIRRRKIKDEKNVEKQALFRKTEGYGDRINPDSLKNLAAIRAEEAIIGMMLLGNEYILKVKDNKVDLSAEDFFSEFNKKVFNEIMKLADSDIGFNEGFLGQVFTLDEISRITKMKIERSEIANNEEIFKECIKTLKNNNNKNELWRKLNERR